MSDTRPTWSYSQLEQVAEDLKNKSIQTRVQQINDMINELSVVLKEDTTDIVEKMNIIEQVIYSCGGEKRASFLEVTTSFIRVQTRVPIDAPVYPVEDSPSFCRKVIELLISTPWVKGIRCYPSSEDRGTILVISIKS